MGKTEILEFFCRVQAILQNLITLGRCKPHIISVWALSTESTEFLGNIRLDPNWSILDHKWVISDQLLTRFGIRWDGSLGLAPRLLASPESLVELPKTDLI